MHETWCETHFPSTIHNKNRPLSSLPPTHPHRIHIAMNPEDLLAVRVLLEMKHGKRPTVKILFDGYNSENRGERVCFGIVDKKVVLLERVASLKSA